ncbi:hypothetical protein RU58_00010 [Achromobacter phage phiAxp-1]|uniref:hypothetical protein n=1 Tax=Achromobacter phage phiAxp-1 TaxID=1610509 RepID=UPI0006557AB0|nr:hypothetical protein RU58_00010 [Achromobacter phage phiAxp-1]AKJ71399.1 hypothetical protein RU58_00010 [Achromobacter phage phiAxp-1]
MKYTNFGALHVGDEFMMVNPAAYPNAVRYRKCSSTEAQHDALRPEPVGAYVVVWPVKVADKRFVSFREIPIGGEFYHEVGGDRYQKIDTYAACNSKTSETIPFGSRVAVLPVVSVKPDVEVEEPAAVGKSTDAYPINLTEKGYLRLTETGSLPVTYLGKTIEIGPVSRRELTPGLIVDAWLEWEQREISTVEDKAAKEAESMVFESFGARYVWTQSRYDTVEMERRNISQTVRESIWQLLSK